PARGFLLKAEIPSEYLIIKYESKEKYPIVLTSLIFFSRITRIIKKKGFMPQELSYYHSLEESGYWTGRPFLNRNIRLRNENLLKGVTLTGIREEKGTLAMVLSTFDGEITKPIDNFLGLRVVRGDSKNHPYEKDYELLIEIHYLKVDQMEDIPRRIRPTGIKFGILGGTSEESFRRDEHRAMGESADYCLEGIDTQYDPKKDTNKGSRAFPFWRIGVWGNSIEMAKEFLPALPPIVE
ncbi:MAG TPA: hypothetical protein VMW91_08245, partial [Desulfosporosinus sp.]|nr:hypothetical protein [Desulfosporosinus sp.]